MNLYLSIGTQKPTFALEVTVTDAGLSYKTYPAYPIEELKRAWKQQVENPMFAPMNTPTPDEKPLWTTDKYAIYDHVEVMHNDIVQGNTNVGSLPSQSIDFQEITNLTDYSDHAIYQIYAPDSPVNIVEKPSSPTNGYSRQVAAKGTTVRIHNSVAHTSSSKFNPFNYGTLTGNGCMIAIMVPLADMTPSEWAVVFSIADEGLIKVNSETQVEILGDPTLGRLIDSHLPKVAFTKDTATVDADGYVDLEFSLVTAKGLPLETEHNAFVYLKTTAGVLNKQQVKTVGGKGNVRLIANHLEAGDVATVSCGFQYYSGTDDCVVTVK